MCPAAAEPVRSFGNRFLLFRPQGVGEAGLILGGSAGGKLVKVFPGVSAVYLKPLCLRLAGHPGDGAEIVVEFVVGEGKATAVLVNGVVPPEDFVGNVGGVMLLPDPLLHALLFGVADLRPALMGRIVRMGIGVDHGDDGLKGADIWCISHYAISFT